MIYLITGSPGTGKTAMAVDMILTNYDGLFEMKLEDGTKIKRPLYFCHIDGLDQRKFKAHELTEEQLQSAPLNELVPEGAVVFVDEADYTYPVRAAARDVPPYIKTLKELRHHGLTLILMTQHPTMLDKYLRQLVGKHIHLERKNIGTKRYEWFRCEEYLNAATFASAVGSMYKPSSKAFNYYKSASTHIKFKKKLHPVFWVFPVLVLIFLYMAIPFFSRMAGYGAEEAAETVQAASQVSAAASETVQEAPKTAETAASAPSAIPTRPVAAAASDLESYKISESDFEPSIEGKPWTAPIYNAYNKAVRTMPYPVACVKNRKRCTCYTDQGTPIKEIKHKFCLDYVENGIYNPYKERVAHNPQEAEKSHAESAPQIQTLSGHQKLTLLPDYSLGEPSAQ